MKLLSCVQLCSWDIPGKNIGVGCHFLLQRIFPTQGSKPDLLHCRQTPYWLSHERSPKEWKWELLSHVLFATPWTSSWNSPSQNTGVGSLYPLQGIFPTQGSDSGLHIINGFFTSWATKEAQEYWSGSPIPSPADLPDPGTELWSPALLANSLPTELWGKPISDVRIIVILGA